MCSQGDIVADKPLTGVGMHGSFVSTQGLNLKELRLGQREVLQTICARHRMAEGVPASEDENRLHVDIEKLLSIMGVPKDF